MKSVCAILCLALVLPAARVLAVESAPVIYDADGDRIAENLETLIAGTSAPLPTIVLLTEAATDAAIEVLQSAVGAFAVKDRYDIISGFAATLTPEQVRRLAANPLVRQVEYDNEVHACLGTATSWFGATKARTDFGVDGNADGSATTYSANDIVIVILDTGIDAAHYDLDGGKVIGWKDYVNSRTTAYDDHGHGTHCASIAAGSGDANSTYRGVAPGAALVGVKVLNSAGSGSTSTITSAVNWVVANKATYGIEVLSMSLGSTGSSDGQDALSLACNAAMNAGIVTCIAAGNAGPKAYTVGSPGAAENVITVGAMADCGEKGFDLASFSSRGPTADNRVKPDVCAPGYNITAALKGTTASYTTMSGTSMATPFIAGTAALMLDAKPTLTPAQVKGYFQTTSQDWGPTGKDNDYGWGRLQAYDAVKAAGGYTGTGPTVPPHVYKSENLAARNKTDIWQVNVNSTAYPIAVTMVMPNWTTSQDFDLYLYNPSGSRVAYATGSTRQELIAYTPTVTGNYKLHVKSYKGSGAYYFDLSCANATSITNIQNQSVEPGQESGALAEKGAEPGAVKVLGLSDGRVSLAFDLGASEEVSLALYDGTGRAVESRTILGNAGRNRAELGHALPAGVYFYRFESASLEQTGKVAVLR